MEAEKHLSVKDAKEREENPNRVSLTFTSRLFASFADKKNLLS